MQRDEHVILEEMAGSHLRGYSLHQGRVTQFGLAEDAPDGLAAEIAGVLSYDFRMGHSFPDGTSWEAILPPTIPERLEALEKATGVGGNPGEKGIAQQLDDLEARIMALEAK